MQSDTLGLSLLVKVCMQGQFMILKFIIMRNLSAGNVTALHDEQEEWLQI